MKGARAVIPGQLDHSMRISMEREPWGAEDTSTEDDKPRIPEPMVFDLMRPLGARVTNERGVPEAALRLIRSF